MSSFNADIRAAIDAMYPDKARDLLRQAMADANAETYFLASLVALDDEQKRDFLQRALDLDPFHREAYKALNALKAAGQSQAQQSQPPTNAWGLSTAASSARAPEPAPPPASQPVFQPISLPQVSLPPVSVPPASPVSAAPVPVNAPTASSDVASVPASPLQVTVTSPEAYLYRFPQKQRRFSESIASGIVLDVIARDHDPNWLNVGFKHQGSAKIGWIETADVSQPKQRGGKNWDVSELPVTYYQYNTFPELRHIERKVKGSGGWNGMVVGAVVAAVVVLGISGSISKDFGFLIGCVMGATLIISSLYWRATNIAGVIRQVDILKRLQKNAPRYTPSRYVAYMGWAHPMPEQIAQADREYEIDRQAARMKAIRNAGIVALIGGGWVLLLITGKPDESAVDFAAAAISLLAIFLAWPVVSYLAVYASDEEKAMALVGIAVAATLVVGAATKSKAGAIQRREEQEAAATRARADAERKRKEEEQRRKAEAEQIRIEQEKQRQQVAQQGMQPGEMHRSEKIREAGVQFDSHKQYEDWRLANIITEQERDQRHGYD